MQEQKARSIVQAPGSLNLLSPSPLLSSRFQPDRARGPARGLGVPGGAEDRCFLTPAATSFGIRRMEISSAAVQGRPIQTLLPRSDQRVRTGTAIRLSG